MSFEKIIGQENVVSQLKSLSKNSRLPHALLFCGRAGVGKFTCARAFAAELMEQKNLAKAQHPDLHILHPIAGKKDISVESTRELCAKLQLKPWSAPRVVAIIDQAEKLSLSAANSLLKILEEPRPGNILILVSQSAHRLPETIVSRMQRLFFGELTEANAESILASLLEQEPKEKNSLASSLAPFACGSLEQFGIKPFLNPESGKVEDPQALAEQLKGLSAELKALRKQVSEIRTLSPARALSLAAEYGAKPNPALWPVLHQEARKLMTEDSNREKLAAAHLLESIISAERWIKERSASAPMQLSEVFLKLARI